MIWEYWIGRHRESGPQPSGKSARRTAPAERRRQHEVSNSGELWKCRRCGNRGIQQQDFHRSHSVLEISRKQRDSHIPTAPTVCYRVSTKQPRLKNGVRWERENPKAGFPLSHRTDGLRRKEETPESVYNAPGTMCIPCAGIDSHSWRRTEVVKIQQRQPASTCRTRP